MIQPIARQMVKWEADCLNSSTPQERVLVLFFSPSVPTNSFFIPFFYFAWPFSASGKKWSSLVMWRLEFQVWERGEILQCKICKLWSHTERTATRSPHSFPIKFSIETTRGCDWRPRRSRTCHRIITLFFHLIFKPFLNLYAIYFGLPQGIRLYVFAALEIFPQHTTRTLHGILLDECRRVSIGL